jgi:hypothetical protein
MDCGGTTPLWLRGWQIEAGTIQLVRVERATGPFSAATCRRVERTTPLPVQ